MTRYVPHFVASQRRRIADHDGVFRTLGVLPQKPVRLGGQPMWFLLVPEAR